MTKEEIINALSEMTVLELSELVAALEAKFGVSAAAPVAIAAASGVVAAAPVAETTVEEEKTEFDVILQEAGPKKIQVIKVVRELTNLGLRESKEVVDGAPRPVLEGISKEEAEAARAKLEEVGAVIELR